jgi:hypothetical protein
MPMPETILDGRTLDSWAWPGGCPIVYLTGRNDVLCPACAQARIDHKRRIDLLEALGFECDEWTWDRPDLPLYHDVHWEGPPIDCEECGKPCESAYGDPDSPESEDHHA